MNETTYSKFSKGKRWKFLIDVMSGVFVAILIAVPIHIQAANAKTLAQQSDLLVAVMTINLLPAVFGIMWLLMRYSEAIDSISRKLPFTRSWLFKLVFSCSFAIVIILSNLLRG